MRFAMISGLLVIALFTAGEVRCGEGSEGLFGIKDLSGSIELAYNSKYVWRGLALAQESVFQPSVSLSYRELTGSIWGNMDFTDENENSGEFNEIDYSMDYSGSWERIGYSFGVIHYRFPNTDFEATTEFYAGVSGDVLLSPSLTLYQDVDQSEGLYLQLGIGHSFEDVYSFSETVKMSVDLSGTLGYGSTKHNEAYYGHDEAELTDATMQVALPVTLGHGLTLSPSINYSTLISDEIREVNSEDDNLWAGVALTWEF